MRIQDDDWSPEESLRYNISMILDIGSAPELLYDKYYLHGKCLRKGEIVLVKTEDGEWVQARFGCGKNPNTGSGQREDVVRHTS